MQRGSCIPLAIWIEPSYKYKAEASERIPRTGGG